MRASAINVGVEFGYIGLRVVLGKIRRRVDDLAHLRVDRLQRLLIHLRRQRCADIQHKPLVPESARDIFGGRLWLSEQADSDWVGNISTRKDHPWDGNAYEWTSKSNHEVQKEGELLDLC